MIIVVTHKKTQMKIDAPYQYISVGGNKDDIQAPWRDDIGDNITQKNPNYCELTALYWFWKNEMAIDETVGLCHYRRFFANNMFDLIKNKPLSKKRIDLFLHQYDIILPNTFRWRLTVGEMYYLRGDGKKKDLETTREVITQLYPKYIKCFDKVINSHEASYCNMFICSTELATEYCDWLFNILFEVEKRVDLTGYTLQESRIFGYISEILLNVWVDQKKLNVKYLPMIKTEDTVSRKIIDYVKYHIKKVNG